jgi:hypothetical protein
MHILAYIVMLVRSTSGVKPPVKYYHSPSDVQGVRGYFDSGALGSSTDSTARSLCVEISGPDNRDTIRSRLHFEKLWSAAKCCQSTRRTLEHGPTGQVQLGDGVRITAVDGLIPTAVRRRSRLTIDELRRLRRSGNSRCEGIRDGTFSDRPSTDSQDRTNHYPDDPIETRGLTSDTIINLVCGFTIRYGDKVEGSHHALDRLEPIAFTKSTADIRGFSQRCLDENIRFTLHSLLLSRLPTNLGHR